MQRNMLMWKNNILASPKRIAIPIMTHPGIDLTGHTVDETVHSSELHAGAVQAVAKAYPTGASTMIMDLSVEAEAFGAKVRFADNEVPAVTGRCVYDEESIGRLAIPDLSEARVGQWLEAARRAALVITDRPVFAGCIGPFSLAARLYDVTEIMTAILIEPESILSLVDKCTRFLITYVKAFKSVGANGIVIAEPVAGVLSADLCTQFVRIRAANRPGNSGRELPRCSPQLWRYRHPTVLDARNWRSGIALWQPMHDYGGAGTAPSRSSCVGQP